MRYSHRRIAALAVVVGTAAAAVALAGPTVGTGWISVTGADSAGVVHFSGQGLVRGSINGGHPSIEIHAGATPIVVGLGGRQRRIPAGADVRIALDAGEQFGVISTGTRLQVILRGPDIAATIAGTGTISFTGRGTYSCGYPPVGRAWPKTALTLLQPKATALHGTVKTSKDADSTTVA